MEQTTFPIVDCDGHILESLAIWDQYLEPSMREQARYACGYFHTESGGDSRMINGKPLSWAMFGASLASAAYGVFGKTPREIGAGMAKRWGEGKPVEFTPQDLTPGGFDPEARLQDMNEMGIAAAVLYPTTMCQLGGVPELAPAVALARAYNDWLADYCSADPRRLYGVAVLPMQHVPAAIDEMRRTVRLGFKGVVVRPNFVNGVSLAHRGFSRFWQEAQDLDIPVSLHPFPTPEMEGAHEITDRWTDETGSFTLSDALTFPFDTMYTLGQLFFGGVLDRFPNFKLGVMESNGSWITMLLERFDKRFHLWKPSGRFPSCKTLPSEQFSRQCYISFEGGEAALPLMAPLFEDQILWASDYPHYDVEEPEEALENLMRFGIDQRIQKKYLSANADRLYRLSVY